MPAEKQPIKIIIADDHEFFRNGFIAALQYEASIKFVAEASNGKELLNLVQQYDPDIVFMDIKMPLLSGLEATKLITAQYPQCAVIALSSYDEHYLVEDMLAAGAIGYLLKNAGKAQVMEAIQAAMEKQKYFCHTIRRIMDRHNTVYPLESGKRKKKISLSPRQTEVLILICEQRSSAEIAEELKLSKRTVEGFRRKLFAKTNAQNEAGLAIYAINNGIYRQA
ncbi:MAG: response regulator transcription factor [Ferruginibacter sp.]